MGSRNANVNSTSVADVWPLGSPRERLAVLVSGGLDSAILLGEAVQHYQEVYPLYVRTGLIWETVERAYLERFLAGLRSAALRPLRVFDEPVRDVYGEHWSLSGDGTPDQDSPDEAVFLPGRNVLLLAKPILWCHLNGVPEIAMAPLSSNPFPDATEEFFEGFLAAVNHAVSGKVRILRPFALLHKEQVLVRGRGLPLEHTLSCIRPVDGLHCGRCNKCAERRRGFAQAGIADPTCYADGDLRRSPSVS